MSKKYVREKALISFNINIDANINIEMAFLLKVIRAILIVVIIIFR